MLYMIYNPLARNCKKINKIKYFYNKALLHFKLQNGVILNISDIDNYDNFIGKLEKDDIICFVGGDGTFNNIVNKIDFDKLKFENIYIIKAGTGNDFARSISRKTNFVNVYNYFKNLPVLQIGKTKRKFLNGIGIGIDGFIAKIVRENNSDKNKISFLKATIDVIKKYETFNCEIEIDGHVRKFKNVWMTSFMNSAYFGGGMKIAPFANRNAHTLDLIVIQNVTSKTLLKKLLSVYLGKHYKFDFVKIIRGQNFKITIDRELLGQVDGENQDYKPNETILISKQ